MNIKNFLIGMVVLLTLIFISLIFIPHPPIFEGCNFFEGEEKDICFLKLAKQKEDPSFCKKIQNHGLSDMCSQKIWERRDCAYWTLIGESKDSCILNTLDQNKLTICYETEKSEAYGDCIDFYSNKASSEKNSSLCLNNPSCLLHYAISTKEDSTCNILKDISTLHSQLCFTYFYINLKNNNSCKDNSCFIFDHSEEETRCENPQNNNNFFFCKTLESINKNKPSICLDSIPPSQEDIIKIMDRRFSCILSTGMKHQNKDYCELIEADCKGNTECITYIQQKKNGCKYFITKDESFCDSAGDLCFKLCNPFSNEKYTSDLCQELRTQEKFIELEYTAPLRQILFR